jgi:hypothetical protein
MTIVAGGLGVLAGIGCRRAGPSDVICTADFRYGMSIYVRDSASGAGLASGSTVIVRDGSFVDSLTTAFPGSQAADGPFVSAGERAGNYTVTVRRAGYRTWIQAGIVVKADECHVIPVQVVARLQP